MKNLFITAFALSLGGTTEAQRDLAVQPYYRTTDPSILGKPNYGASLGNPLKGLAGGARWATPPLPDSIPLAIEWYNIGLDEIMVGDNKFDWTKVEGFLAGSASRKMHAVLSVFIHWPGQPLRLPPHLKNIKLYNTDNGKSPNYGDARLLTALQQFISAWGKRMDGDQRVAAIHVGLLGFWGEGHTYPDETLVPEKSKKAVAEWYRSAFLVTQVQARYPGPNAETFGLYDGSLAYQTLDGPDNGNVERDWFMWPKIKAAGQEDSWKKHMIGGETRPEIQEIIFKDNYPAGDEWRQSFKKCVNTLHISYALHHDAFQNNGYDGEKLKNARAAHAYMGYSFYVSEVYASVSATAGRVDVGVTVVQSGVAPFYYDLSLVLECNGATKVQVGVNDIVEKGQSKVFVFKSMPATDECLNALSVKLDSSYAYEGRPVVFAQGSDGSVSFRLPKPKTGNAAPLPTTVSTPASPPKAVPVKAVAPVRAIV